MKQEAHQVMQTMWFIHSVYVALISVLPVSSGIGTFNPYTNSTPSSLHVADYTVLGECYHKTIISQAVCSVR